MDESLVTGRQKRRKLDKFGKFAALQKLKGLKGAKHKYEVSDVDSVYEEVDEKEYSKKVADRQDDWIVDDDGSGYVEDGRDIFDDDLDEESISKNASNSEKSKKRSRASSKVAGLSDGSSGSSLRNMFMNMPVKKKVETNVKLENDDILGDIMAELNNEGNKSSGDLTKKAMVNEVKSERDYLKSLRQPEPRKMVKPATLKKEVQLPPEKTVTPKPVVVSQEPESPIEEKVPESQLIEDFEPEIKEECTEETFIEDCTDDLLQGLDGVNEINWENEFELQDPKTEAKLQLEVKQEPADIKTENDLTEEQLSVVWDLMEESTIKDCVQADVTFEEAEIPLTVKEDGTKVFRFFWLDAFEDPFVQPGVVYLFGKVWVEKAKTYVSCCVTVRNIDRRIYLLPRDKVMDLDSKMPTDEEVSMTDVYNEFNTVVAPKYKIKQFKSRKVEKHYAFNLPNIPATSEYLEVRYSALYQALKPSLKGATFSHVFGTTTNSLELFLLDRRIKGPCWLDVKEVTPVNNPVSWCKLETVVEKLTNITVYNGKPLPPPPLVVVALSMKTVFQPKTHMNEIVMISCLVHHSYHLEKQAPNPPYQDGFAVLTKPSDVTWPFDFQEALKKHKKVDKSDSERGLLACFLAKLYKFDPDLIVGHDIVNFDLKVLLQRILSLKVPLWSRLGRIRRTHPSKSERKVMVGRLVCDMKISGKELIRCRSYDLAAMCETVLRMKTEDWEELTVDDVRKAYSAGGSLFKIVRRLWEDGGCIFRLMAELNVIPLALQITNIAGNLMSRTLMGGRSERNEYLLLHAFTEKDYIVPDKISKGKKARGLEGEMEDVEDAANETVQRKGKNKPTYSGGLVLEPKKGFYDKLVLLMDFNSLYPSIIQEYNICFTTVTVVQTEGSTEAVGKLPESGTELGILPIEIRKLVESRKQVKNLMKAPDLPADLKIQYNIRQMALKLTANSMYGCLGFSFSRFFAKPLAALVTAKGREILTNTQDLVQKLNYDVIYGDTDSIMINTNCLDYGEVFKIGNKIKAEVNKLYRLIELDVDGVFKYMLLLKKKKYAAVTMTQLPNGEIITSQELKGLDIVRRDWSKLSAETGKQVLSHILSDLPPDERIERIHTHLERIAEDLRSGKVPLTLLAITKQLTKNPEEYADHKSQPHVQVAMRFNSRGGKKLRAGDTVSYVICEDGTNLSPVQRAYSPEELKSNESLKIDVNYYLSQQIHPVVSRLCEPIDGTDAVRIAECLGLDSAAYHKQIHKMEDKDELGAGEKSFIDTEDRFKDSDPLKFTCKNEKCKKEVVVTSPFRKTISGAHELVLESCGNPDCELPPLEYLPSILNCVTLSMRTYIQLYYLGWMICEDPACPQRTRRLPLRFLDSRPICTLCEKAFMFREYTDHQLYVQIEFFEFMFDLSRIPPSVKRHLKPAPSTEEAYAKAKEHVERTLLHSAYSVVDLGQLFADCGLSNQARIKTEIKPEPLVKIKEEPMDF